MSALTQSVLAWLATYAIHSTLLLGLAWLVLRLRRADAASANLVWKLALVGGIVTASLQMGLGVRPGGTVLVGVASRESRVASEQKGDVSRESRVSSEQNEVASRESRDASEVPSAGDKHPQAEPGNSQRAARDSRLETIILSTWLLLAAGLITWYAGRRLVLVGRLGDRRPVRTGAMAERLTELRRMAGVQRPIALTASTAISSPVALGSSEICLPAAALADLAPDQQDAMLAHELAHLVRRDPQWLVLACLVERTFFFQPLNRLARRGLMESAEYLADDWAAHRSGHVPLARCLVKVAEWIQASPLGVPMAGMAEERSHLSARVSRLLDTRNPSSTMPRHAAALLSTVALAATVAFVPGAATRADEPTIPSATDAPAPESIVPGASLLADTGLATSGTRPGGASVDQQDLTPDPRPRPETEPNTGRRASSPSAPDTTVVKALIERLGDEDAGVRRAAADALGQIENPLAIPGLVKTLDDPDREVRSAALDALGQFEKGVPAEPVRRMLTADDPEMRRGAVEMLGEMRDRPSRAAIERLVADPDAGVRHEALHSLGHLNDPASIKVVASALTDAEAEVRQTAYETLEDMKADVDPALVARGFQDQNSEVRQSAVELAESRRMSSLSGPLAGLLSDSIGQVREAAAEALTEMGTQEARDALRTAMTHSDPKVRRVAVEYFGEEGDQ